MGVREDAIRAHADFPWLDLEDGPGIAAYLNQSGLLEQGEAFVRCESAGEGNMNLTLRVHTSARRFILKQARPWVEKYPEIEAPWNRNHSELRFYELAKTIPDVGAMMPALLASDRAAHVLLLEDLADATDLTSLYSVTGVTSVSPAAPDDRLPGDEIDLLASYLAALHSATRATVDAEFANREMRALNHAHLFEVPLDPNNGLDLDAFEQGLSGTARQLINDSHYRRAVKETADRYLRDGPCLVHGDYYPGSWLRTTEGLRIIDPEFSFLGDPEVDLGCAVAHLALAAQPVEVADHLLASYRAENMKWDPTWLARYAAIEVMRRLIGVAQLPLPASKKDGESPRGKLLERSRRAMASRQLEDLF